MSEFIWYCPECQSEGSDRDIEFCENDGARLRPLASRGGEWIGKVLADKYRIVRFVDAGGTADVFEAERLSSGKRVAVKLLHAASSGAASAVERFLQEAQLVSRIAHPNVVEIFDFGTLDGAVQFMAMELLAGRSLAAEIAGGPMPIETALKYALQACEGLAAAHERGVIHCDIKPANLFLQETGDGVVVKILDLGIGRMHAHGPESGFVDSGLIAGTPEYMSPEQATALPMGPATDIYAMGVVLWEILLGRLPFEASNHTEVLAKQVYEIPLWPMDLATARGLPLEAGPIVLRALAKKPRDRQPSMVDLQRDVAALAGVMRGRKGPTDRPTVRTATQPGPVRRASGAPASLPSKPPSGSRRATPSTGPRRSTPEARAASPRPSIHTMNPRPSINARFERVTLAEATGSDREIVEVAPDVFWVGRRQSSALECNAYLRVFRRDGADLSMLVDPGPPRDFEVISAKVAAVIGSIRRLDFVFLNHQDPDVTGNAAAIQQAAPRAHVLCSEDTWRIVQSDGLDPRRYTAIERFPGGVATLATGHKIEFLPTPFCHFRGAVMLYDPATRVLFSGDLFGGTHTQQLVASGARWWNGVQMFHQIYMPSSPALALAAERIKRLDPPPAVIAPQHGSLILGASVGPVVDAIGSLPVGLDVADSCGSHTRFIAAANDMVSEYIELAGVDEVRRLLAGQGDDGSFTCLFVLRGLEEIAGFKVQPSVALEALASEALATLSPEQRGELQRSLRAIRRQHGLNDVDAPPGASVPPPNTVRPD